MVWEGMKDLCSASAADTHQEAMENNLSWLSVGVKGQLPSSAALGVYRKLEWQPFSLSCFACKNTTACLGWDFKAGRRLMWCSPLQALTAWPLQLSLLHTFSWPEASYSLQIKHFKKTAPPPKLPKSDASRKQEMQCYTWEDSTHELTAAAILLTACCYLLIVRSV